MNYFEKISNNTWRINVLVQPRARKDEIAGIHDQRMKIRIKAPPVDGKANHYLCAFLAGVIGLRRNQVVVEKGLSSRCKSVVVSNVDRQTMELFFKKIQ
ncbi:DUF167 domain-containing protein [Desulfonatronovibrio hydrogenovorans]|uniref:DUF167 domain-containing protein n=1 Tax=Desulfonatronovibrio hydrogenovorans TaxID=53245 RepID=UPI00048CCE4D|nr:DUF167 family protein [Desulfonatronovibrio hydrogenovorans]